MKKLIISCIVAMLVSLPVTFVISCRAAPTSTQAPTSFPEPPQELIDAIPFAEPKEGSSEAWREAQRAFFAAYQCQLQGELEEAIELYKRSIDIFPTAESYTFSGLDI